MVKQSLINQYNQSLEIISEFKKLPSQGVYTDCFFNDPSFFIYRTRELLNRCGLSGDEIPIIHITGTSGKGTLAHTLATEIINSGQKTGLFTSPPLQVQTERFVIDSKMISITDYEKYLDLVINHAKSMIDCKYGRPSIGEVNTVLAYKYFVDSDCDIAVVEALAGGQFDATNVLENKILTAITRIGLDHMHILGDTKEKIAIDKAHICRSGVKLFCGETDPKLSNLIKTVCENEGANYEPVRFDDGYDVKKFSGAILSELGIDNDINPLILPGRFEVFNMDGKTVILDGAHNEQKVMYLLNQLKSKYPDQDYNLLLATSNNKNSKNYVKKLLKSANSAVLTSFKIADEMKHNPKLGMRTINELELIAKESNSDYSIETDPNLAFEQLLKSTHTDQILLVSGSMFLVGKIREQFYSSTDILEQQTMFPKLLK